MADATNTPGDEEKRALLEKRMRECEYALSLAQRELRSINNARYITLARIEQIHHDIDFIAEHMNYPELVEPYDFSEAVNYSDYGMGAESPRADADGDAENA